MQLRVRRCLLAVALSAGRSLREHKDLADFRQGSTSHESSVPPPPYIEDKLGRRRG